jgi:hypothetical protein
MPNDENEVLGFFFFLVEYKITNNLFSIIAGLIFLKASYST